MPGPIGIVDPHEKRRLACAVAIQLELGVEVVACAEISQLLKVFRGRLPIALIIEDGSPSGLGPDTLLILENKLPDAPILPLRINLITSHDGFCDTDAVDLAALLRALALTRDPHPTDPKLK